MHAYMILQHAVPRFGSVMDMAVQQSERSGYPGGFSPLRGGAFLHQKTIIPVRLPERQEHGDGCKERKDKGKNSEWEISQLNQKEFNSSRTVVFVLF